MNSKACQLYHYTSFDNLKDILKDGGFWPGYSIEHFSWSQQDKQDCYLAFPCTCFCDLPLGASAMHRDDYGHCVISFDKTSNLATHLTPVIYLNEEGPLANMIRDKYGQDLRGSAQHATALDGATHFEPAALDPEKLRDLWKFLPYLKSALGHTLLPRPRPQNAHDAETGLDYEWTTKRLEEEFEWRYVPPKHSDTLYCFEGFDRWNIKKRKQLSQATKDSLLKFGHEEVEAVIVTNECERDKIVAVHPCLEKKVKTWQDIPCGHDCAN